MYFGVRAEVSDFFVIPRGILSFDTGRVETSEQLEICKNNWALLTQQKPTLPTKPRFKVLSHAIRSFLIAASQRGFHVSVVRRKRRFPFAYQHRVIVADTPCSVMSAPRLSPDSKAKAHNVVLLKKPKDEWGQFVVYVVAGMNASLSSRFAIIPTSEVTHTTTRSLSSKWLSAYLDNWDRFRSDSKGAVKN